MGASLKKWLHDSRKPLEFFSRKFLLAHRNYTAYDRELTAIYEAVRHFRYFLEGKAVTIIADHKTLIYMFSQRIERILHTARPLHLFCNFRLASNISCVRKI